MQVKNYVKLTDEIVEFIRDYYQKNNLKGAVIGISGGKDSAVAAALFVKALGAENVLGVTLPCESKDEDRVDALKISDYYNFEMVNIELTDTYKTFKRQIKQIGKFTDEETFNGDINLKPRLRMASLYYMAALYSSIKGGTYIVAGTSNKCELFVGYFTKGGDSVSDIKVLANLSVRDVIKVGEVLNVPEEVLYKKPTDGITEVSDEDKLGVTYMDIEKYMNGENLPLDVKEKIEKLHKKNLHKLVIPEFEL